MRLYSDRVLLSATDLNTFLGCRHASALDFRKAILGEALEQAQEDAGQTLVKQRGEEHERFHFHALRAAAQGEVVWLRDRALGPGLRLTQEAMRRGAHLIFQGVLADGAAWHGYTDFLVRADAPSALGTWSYEVHDTKLARSLKAKFAVQLALYADLVARAQGADPPALRVVLGDGAIETLRTGDYVHYVRHAMRRLEAASVPGGPSDPGPATAAEPCAACPECGWRERCDAEWEEGDHLHRVANIRSSQVARLREAGIGTLAALAVLPEDTRIAGIAPEVLERLRSQAALQDAVRGDPEARRHVLLDPGPWRGLARLPPPNPHDLFFDMEGDPLYPDGGLEYLFGVDGPGGFQAFWALDPAQEKAAFEAFIDHATAAMVSPDARIYHYNHYETTALKRLAMRHGTREAELDALLRGRRFVDLYVVVREALRISEPRYSLKNVERFYRPARHGDVGTAVDSIVAFERWLEVRDQAILDGIEAYNRDDCVSTRELRDWLVTLRPPEMGWAQDASENEDPERKARREAEEAEVAAVRTRLVDGAPVAERSFRELVAHLSAFHRREQKPGWWAMFDRQTRNAEDLADDAECLGGLQAVGPPFKVKLSMAQTYRFPPQDTKLRPGSQAIDAATLQPVAIEAIDEDVGTVTLKRGIKKEPLPERLSVAPPGPRDDAVLRGAVRRFADSVAAGDGRFLALEALLRRDPPWLRGRSPGSPMRRPGETALEAALAACRDLDGGYLFVQGPPGTGKTWTASRMIVDAIRHGKRVGVSALSHKAINNLLHGVEAAAHEAGVVIRGVKKSDPNDEDTQVRGTMIVDIFDNKDIPDDAELVAGTAWLFARGEQEGTLDLLFVDEAGQVSLANLVAMGTAARNIVLVGDQMQLGQPIQGAHPGGSGASALEHLLQGAAVVPPEQGIFLAETHRMHPDLCGWVSQAIYQGQLSPHSSCGRQALLLADAAHPALVAHGLKFRQVAHTGRSQRSDEEVAEVVSIWHDLMRHHWCDRRGTRQPITADDVLVVAPWNVQVNALRRALPETARVGTVDKFQGQEAAVVLVSMTSSAAEDIPRGIGFLFSRERLNVAISRARCLAVVLASHKLLEVPCTTVDDLRLVNTLCHVHAWGT